ncbi:hypothetical protein KAI12_02630 [Candidatus Bathyarchaeota archaeon]|nr:hypothetical protein [Candidatus Bathyarchaeota archaeon]
MNTNIPTANERLQKKITEECRKISGSCQIAGICIFGNYVLDPLNTKAAIEVLLVVRRFRPRLMNYFRVLDKRNILIIAVDKWIFDKDVDRGFLGGALAGILIFPYIDLFGDNYLRWQEITLKKHLISELLENAALNFTELIYSLRFKPQYFMYESMLNRARFYPTVTSTLTIFLKESENKEKVESALLGYLIALKQLEGEGKVGFVNGYVKISKKLVARSKNPKVILTNISRIVPRAILTTLLGLRPQIIDFFSSIPRANLRSQESNNKNNVFSIQQILDPQQYVYVPTAHGLISLAETGSIEFFAKKVLSDSPSAKVEIEAHGGLLNDVYVIRVQSQKGEKKALVKRFRNWSSLKWFSLNLWSVGAQNFSVLGRSRLERECAINELLYSNGFKVPRILYISHTKRLVFMEYIDGEGFDKYIKRFVISENAKENQTILETVRQIGALFAKVHILDISLGDTKPENLILSENGDIYIIDLEQASREGDKSWDIAEFLYYSGHHMPPFNGYSKANEMAQAFIQGYLGEGGMAKILRKAGTPKYTRVFSVFTIPSILLTMSNSCRKAGQAG